MKGEFDEYAETETLHSITLSVVRERLHPYLGSCHTKLRQEVWINRGMNCTLKSRHNRVVKGGCGETICPFVLNSASQQHTLQACDVRVGTPESLTVL